MIGQVTAPNTNWNPTDYAVVFCTNDAGATATPTSVFTIDGNGNIKVTLGGDVGLDGLFFNLTIAAGDSANPDLLANQVTTIVRINIKPTVVITGDFQGVSSAMGCGQDNIDLKFVRVAASVVLPLTVPYTINLGTFDPDTALVNYNALANTGWLTGQVTFADGQDVVHVVLTPQQAVFTGGQASFNVRLNAPAAGDPYFVPPYDTSFWIPSMHATGV